LVDVLQFVYVTRADRWQVPESRHGRTLMALTVAQTLVSVSRRFQPDAVLSGESTEAPSGDDDTHPAHSEEPAANWRTSGGEAGAQQRDPVAPAETDPVRVYLNEIRRVPLLDREEETAIGRRIEHAQEKLRDILNAMPCLESITRLSAHPIVPKMLETGMNELRRFDAERRVLEAEPRESRRVQELREFEGRIGVPRARFCQLVAEALEYDNALRSAKAELIGANLRLVVAIAKRFRGKGLPLLDLIQEGNIGLMTAVDRFDHRRGFRFSTYATWWIRQVIQRAIADTGRTIRLPMAVVEALNKIERSRRVLAEELQREPTLEEVARRAEMAPLKVQKLLRTRQLPCSLEAPVGSDIELGRVLQGDAPSQEEAMIRRNLKIRVAHALRPLSALERAVLFLRFGIGAERAHTYQEIALRFSMSRKRVRQIETGALRKVRRGSLQSNHRRAA
jgi:RNA polymerase sigma factor (sigma-70 family)